MRSKVPTSPVVKSDFIQLLALVAGEASSFMHMIVSSCGVLVVGTLGKG